MQKSNKAKLAKKTLPAKKAAKSKKAELPAIVTNAAPIIEKAARFLHNATNYNASGIISQSFGKKSASAKTPLFIAEFNQKAGAMLTPRDNAFLAVIKAQYKNAPFPRGDADAGNMRRAIERGFIAFHSGATSKIDGREYTTGADALFILTENALSTRFS